MNELDDQIEQALRDAAREVEHDGRAPIDDVRVRARRFAGRRRARRAAVGCLAVALVVAGVVAVRSSTPRRVDWAASTSFAAVERGGLRVEVPEGWSVQPEPPDGPNPKLVFFLASRAIGPSAYCDDRGFPDPTPTDLLPTDVVVQIRERLPDDRAPASPPVGGRPDAFDPTTMAIVEDCRNVEARFYRLGFTDEGRQFDVMLIAGDDASSEAVALGWEVLNRFTVR